MPFSIGETERDQWMFCMISAMHEISIEEPILTKMATQLYGVAILCATSNHVLRHLKAVIF
jgi:hemoglobin